jgi:hypothetical protein
MILTGLIIAIGVGYWLHRRALAKARPLTRRELEDYQG